MAKQRGARKPQPQVDGLVVSKKEKPVGNPLIPKTKNQKAFIRTIAENALTNCIAPAGTGKTHVSIGMACDYLMRGSQNGGVDRIVISKPLAQCGPGVGHLPGTIQAKADPFMGPILDALHHFLGEQKTKDFISKGMIQIVPLEVMRGTNLHNTFVILDEMQNCTYLQLKMFATRLGNDSKCVISGDLRQSDLDRYNFSNSDILQERFIDKLKGKPDIGYCELGIEDIVRSGIAKTIITSLD